MKKIIGILLLPFLYVRWSFIIVLPITYLIFFNVCIDCAENGNFIKMFFFFWFTYSIFFGFIMGNLDLMIPYTKWFLRVFKVDYKVLWQWKTRDEHSFSYWSYPIVHVEDFEAHLKIKSNGGNMYDEKASINRDILWIYFFKS